MIFVISSCFKWTPNGYLLPDPPCATLFLSLRIYALVASRVSMCRIYESKPFQALVSNKDVHKTQILHHPPQTPQLLSCSRPCHGCHVCVNGNFLHRWSNHVSFPSLLTKRTDWYEYTEWFVLKNKTFGLTFSVKNVPNLLETTSKKVMCLQEDTRKVETIK